MLLQARHRKVHGTLQREVATITGVKTLTKKLLGVAFVLSLLGCDNGSTSSDYEQESKQPVFEYGTLIDSRDQAQYKTIKIGSQNWMAENLRYAYFDNDDVSCEGGLSSKCDSLGRFYSWAETMDTLNSGCGDNFYLTCTLGKYAMPKHFRGICPEGWRIPTVEDWNVLIDYAGGFDSASVRLLTRDKFREGEDSYGFKALRISYPSQFENCRSRGELSSFWGVSERGPHRVDVGSRVYIEDGISDRCYQRFSIRCIEGESLDVPHHSYKTEYSDSVLVDKRDGQTYKVVAIGNEVWMAENLNYEYEVGVQSACIEEDSVNCQKYGRLYTWTEAMGLDSNYGKDSIGVLPYPHQGICPEGWHIPSVDEFKKLFEAIGGYAADENGMYLSGDALRTVDGWGISRAGTDLVGFSALPAGVTDSRLLELGTYGLSAGFWSDMANNITLAPSVVTYAYYLDLGINQFHDSGIDVMMSVRCVKDYMP